MNVLIVIPVFNHSKTLRDVVERSLKIYPDVLVIDDGSTDRGIDTLDGLPVRILRHPVNSGKGSAILTGLKEALKSGMTHIVTIDADGQHDPLDILNLIPVIKENPDALVVGKRRFGRNNVPWISRFGRAFSNFWFRVQTGRSLQDTQSGFRAYPVTVLDQLKLTERRFSFEIEVLVKSAWAGVPLKEVEVSVHYPPRSERVSHFHPIMDNLLITLLNTRLTIRSLLPFPHRKINPDRRITWIHPIKSLKILLKEEAEPATLAFSGALGIFLGTLPLIMFQTIAILFSSGYFRLNRIVALTSSQLCIPPFVPAVCIEIGHYLRYGRFLTEISLNTIGYQGLERIYEWVIGSVILAPVLATIMGMLIYFSAIILKLKQNEPPAS
ncbi:MAG: DUF2062 domain-containing protein [Thermodesulfobacteriota bacterium]